MGKTRCINCMKMIDEETAFCPHCGFGQKGETSPFGLKPGTILRGRYLVGRMLGQGGFGLTYVGYDLTLEIKTAIKEYFPSGLATRNSTVSNQVHRNTTQLDRENWQAGCESFLKEARRMAKIDSLPGIVRVRDTFPENQTAYIVMDFIEGETLKQRLSKTGPMKYSECVKLLRPLMESLGEMHGHGLIHRDISPDNIMVQPGGSVCLLDFGAAKDITFQNAASQQVAKKGFSPPEQYREKGSIGPWTDVYALCATIYYCITGKLVPEAMDRMYEDTLDFDVFLSEPLSEDAAGALKDGLKLRTEERIRTVEELLGRFDGTGTTGKETGAGTDSVGTDDAGTGGNGTGGKRAGGAEPDNAGTDDTRTDDPESGVGADMGRQADFQKSPHPQQDDRAASREGDEEPQDRGAVGQEDRTVPEKKEEERPDAQKKKISKKAIGAAAVAAVLVLAVIGLASGSGGKDADTASQVVSGQTEEELSDDARQTQEEAADNDKASADGAEETPETFNMLMADNSCEVSKEKYGDYSPHGTVLGSEISRDEIAAVHFANTLDGVAADAWDVSQGKEGTVMAWTQPSDSDSQMLDLWIGAEGKIAAADCMGMFKGYHNMEVIFFNDCFDTSLTTNMNEMFSYCKKLAQLDVSGFDTGQVTDMYAMFYYCESLAQLDVSGFDTGQVTDMDSMFSECLNLTQLDVSGFNTSQVRDMKDMFSGCENLGQLDVSGFDTSQVEDMFGMFYDCASLARLNVSGFDTSQVTDMCFMFGECERLQQLDLNGFDTSQVTDMCSMFEGCRNLMYLDLSSFDTSRVTDMESMFEGCDVLMKLDLSGFDTSQVTDMGDMFWLCRNLKMLDVSSFDTSQVTNMSSMFNSCMSLTELDLSGFDMGQVESTVGMFVGCGVTAEQAGLKTE